MAHDQKGSAMDCSSDESSELSETDIDDYADKSYLALKSGKFVTRLGSDRFRCPFCPGKKQDYCYNELLQHAVGVGASNRAAKVKANHQALAKLLKEDHADAAATLPPWKAMALSNPPKPVQDLEVFVSPWMGILTNVPVEETRGGGAILMEQLADFKPIQVSAVYGACGYTGHVIVLFSKDWIGFKNALAFHNYFKSQHLGKLEWKETKQQVKYVFGWMAKEEDYKSNDPVGRFLSANGDMKTVSKLQQGMSCKKRRLTFDLEEIEGFSELLPAKKLKSSSRWEATEQDSKENAIDGFNLLPNDVICSIICCLSIYDAAKTATLSKDFLSSWRSYPQLSFILGKKNPSLHMLRSIGSIIEKHDQQSIQRFFLHGFLQKMNQNLEQWIQILSTKSSKNFSLEICSRSMADLPNCVFRMNNISELRLHRCVIQAPDLVCFPLLSKLSLKYCRFQKKSENDVQHVILGCPNCTDMELVNNILPKTPAYSHVDINQLLLKDLSLKVEDSYTTWTVCSKHLSYAKIKAASDLNPQLLEQVQNAEKLSLSAMTILAPITFQFNKLVDLTLDLFMDNNSMTSAFDLLEHSPHLKYFQIEFNDMGLWKEPELFWETQQSRSFPLGLEVVHVKGFTGTDLSADFLKFIASRQSVERIIVTLDANVHVTGYGNAITVLKKLREDYPSLHLTVFG